MKAFVDINNFASGELSPKMRGRTDVAKYFNGCDVALNMVGIPQGGMTARPGTVLAAKSGDQANAVRTIRFVFSTVQAYVIEFGHLYARFFMNHGPIVSGGVPVQIVTPYTAADLAAIAFTQSADELFLCHPDYPTQILSRASHTDWSIAPMVFRDGPYLAVNSGATTLSCSGLSGSITVTASATDGINATPSNTGQGFLATDAGRAIRIKLQSLWAWGVITAVASSTQVTVFIEGLVNNGAWGSLDGGPWTASTLYPSGAIVTNGGNTYLCTQAGISAPSGGPTGAGTGTPPTITDNTVVWKQISAVSAVTTQWQLGKWSATTGYPYLPMFWQNRLALCGTNNQPSALEFSVVGDFTSFAPTQADGSVTAANAMSWIISDDEVNAVRWVSPAGSAQGAQFGVGTAAGENVIQAGSQASGISATNVQAYRETSLGSAPYVRPQRIGKAVLFTNRAGRKLYEWTFQWTVNGYIGIDLSDIAEHITAPGLVQLAYQQSPHSVVWGLKSDGQLISLTYGREQAIVGWQRHRLGGQYAGGPPVVESIAVIPSPDGSYDELWLAVLRTIGGVATRTIEVMSRYFDRMPVEQAVFVDCSLSTTLTPIGATVTPSGFTNAAADYQAPSWAGTGTLAAGGSVFTSASVGQLVRLNGGLLKVTGFTDGQHVTAQALLPMTSLATAAANAWTMDARHVSASGLDHLDGETVAVLGDGQVYPRQLVSGGAISLPEEPASLVTAGLPYQPVLVTMPWESPRTPVSAGGRIKRADHYFARFHETVGGQFGTRMVDEDTFVVSDHLETIQSRTAYDPMDQAPPLFTGIRRLSPPGGYDREFRAIFTQPDPLPLTVLAVSISGDVAETGPA